MAVKFTNNAFSSLASSITNSATSLSVQTGDGAKFPSLSGSDYFYATLFDSSNNIEIIKVTARSTDTFTIARGQDGTSGRAYSSGDRIELRIPAVTLNAFWNDERQHATTSKSTPVDADEVFGSDSASSNAGVRFTFTNMWTNYIKTKADALYQPLKTILTTLGNLADASGVLTNDGSGGLSWASGGSGPSCKAWVNFNGTGTVSIRNSYNVSSITDNGTGDFTINFTSALATADYAAFCMGQPPTGAGSGYVEIKSGVNPTTSAIRVTTGGITTVQNVRDLPYVMIGVFL